MISSGIIISRSSVKASFISLGLYSPLGFLLCMQRISKKGPSAPDLFDQVDVTLAKAKTGDTHFINEFVVTRKHDLIATHYPSFEFACKLLQLYHKSLKYSDNYTQLLDILKKSLNAFEQYQLPEIIYLKALYRIAYCEGFPVKEDWFPQLPKRLKSSVPTLLSLPLASQDNMNCELLSPIIENLKNWLIYHADFVF